MQVSAVASLGRSAVRRRSSLMDIEDMPRAVRGSARVLAPGGQLRACVTHPLADAGRWERREADAPFVIEGSYFGRLPFEGRSSATGSSLAFQGWCYPLEDYFRAPSRRPVRRGRDAGVARRGDGNHA
jgi:hypothetical protein